VVVTNTNNSATGTKTAAVTSAVAAITVTGGGDGGDGGNGGDDGDDVGDVGDGDDGDDDDDGDDGDEPKIGSYTFDNSAANITFASTIWGGILGAGLLPKSEDYTGNIQANIGGFLSAYLINMETQSNNLKSGYTAVAAAYPDLAGILGGNDSSGIRGREQNNYNQIEQTSNAATYVSNAISNGSYIDGILTSIFGNGNAARTDFDKYYDAYTKGHYYNQKKVGDKSTLLTDFQNACTAAGFSYTGNVANDLQTIKTQLLNKINTQMGLSGIANETDRNTITALNGHLLSQLEDLHQYRAFVNDVSDPTLGYTTDFGMTINEAKNYFTFAPSQQSGSKATHLANGFDPALLQGNGKKKGQAEIV
jgi:hypothetical protein